VDELQPQHRGVYYHRLSEVLPEALLELTESDEESSRYIWACGCVAIRPVNQDVCEVLWCSAHAK
jgi:hypothetical protein